ncbi:Transmembrane protein [Pseudolycoriella hygida]|uniref:Transmembrane protein n=1 Tax=Pseudolycoriella hygida TaxID=35572 RepID=A0A9Q0MHL4_9DIPT|nr:Transmembrane protein [Pseudolycoriella hygida]
MVGSDLSFIPPKKRQTTKKPNGTQNYVDHIVSSRTKQSPTLHSPDDCIMNASLILNKSNSEKRLSADDNRLSSSRDLNSIKALNEREEVQNFDTLSPPSKECSAILTSRSYSEDSSLDAKSSLSQDCLTTQSTKKRVNIKTDFLLQRNQRNSPNSTNYDDLESGETSILNAELDKSSLDRYNTLRTDSYLTMTGTVKRGRKKGQSVDLQLNISRDELEKINAAVVAVEQIQQQSNDCCVCSLTTGMHILLLSIICVPFVAVYTSIYSFYIGTLTWYNIFNYFNEEKSYLHKLLMSPILILTYPFGICICAIGLGIYAGLVQLSFSLTRWYNELTDVEKGFYGWLCSFLHLSDCSPYEVVILTDLRLPETVIHGNSSTEELSL